MESEIERLNKMRERIIEKAEKIKPDFKPPKQDLEDEGYGPMTFTIHPKENKTFAPSFNILCLLW